MRTAALVLFAAALASCDQGRWIELPPLLLRCADLDDSFRSELADPDKFSLARGMLQGVCTQSAAGAFTGDARCREKVVQIRCRQ